MAIAKTEHLASFEILFPSRAIQVAWHTYITEDGEVISGPSIRRRAYVGDELSEILPEIQGVISGDYVQLVEEGTQQSQLIAQLQAAAADQLARIEVLESIVEQREARIAELEGLPPAQQESAA